MRDYWRPLFVVAAALGVVGLLCLGAFRTMPLTDIDLAALESGDTPRSRFVQFDGVADPSSAFAWDGRTYVAVGSTAETNAVVIIEMEELDEEALDYGTFVGLLDRNVIGPASAMFPFAVWTLSWRQTPNFYLYVGFVLLCLAGLALLITLTLRNLERRGNRP